LAKIAGDNVPRQQIFFFLFFKSFYSQSNIESHFSADEDRFISCRFFKRLAVLLALLYGWVGSNFWGLGLGFRFILPAQAFMVLKN
jgi:hypothetical protein